MMPNDSQASRDYCADLVKLRDEDRWLAVQYAPAILQRRLIALAALQCELRNVPAAVSEPPLGEIRLQWWRDALDELRSGRKARAHPVIEELSAAEIFSIRRYEKLDRAIDATARTLYGSDFTDIDDLATWIDETDGAFDDVGYCLAMNSDTAPNEVSVAGGAFAMAREGARLAPQLATGIPAAASGRYNAYRKTLAAAPAQAAPAILHLALARDYARSGERPFPLRKRVRLFQAMAFSAF